MVSSMIGNKWDEILKDEFEKTYFKELLDFIQNEYKTKTIYPYFPNVFNALKYTDYDDVKVVILGQDPYHGTGEAHGLSFSVLEGVIKPPSLRNIFKELKDDLKFLPLRRWHFLFPNLSQHPNVRPLSL